MVLHWFSTAWRQLIANPLFSLITVASLSIGCCGALLAGADIKQHLSFEHGFHDVDRIVMVRMRVDARPGSSFAQGSNPVREGEFGYDVKPALKAAIEGKLPGMKAQARVFGGGSMLADERGEGTADPTRYVDPAFFDVFDFAFMEGDAKTAFATPESIVLTRSKAQELFGKEPAFGKELKGVRGHIFKVGAVISDPPQPTMFDFKLLGSIATRDLSLPIQDKWGTTIGPAGHFIRIADGVDRKAFIASANDYIKAVFSAGYGAVVSNVDPKALEQMAKAGIKPPLPSDFEYRVSLIPITDIHLAPRDATGVSSSADITMLETLGAAAGALLAVSAFNYVILSLARALRRKREVGIRKAVGASGGAIMRHYLAEAALVTAISLAVGFALAELLHPWFARTIGQKEDLFNLYDAGFLAAACGGFLLLALLVGAYPALYLAHVRPRTGLDSGGNESFGGPGRLVTVGLLGLEIAAATILLIVTLTMAAQARYVADRPLGFNLKNLYAITADCVRRSTNEVAASNPLCSSALDRLVHQTPGIKRVAYSSTPSIFTSADPRPITRPGSVEKLGAALSMSVDADFLPLAGAKLLAGRLLDGSAAYDRRVLDTFPTYPPAPFESAPVVVTRAILPMLGAATPQAALGQRIAVGQSRWAKSYEIVGVIEDWHQRSLRYSVAPIVFIPGGTMMNVVAEIDEADLPAVLARLTPAGGFTGATSYATASPYVRLSVKPLETAFEETYESDRKLMSAVATFAIVAIAVAGLGVFGLSAFDVRRRVREIGIRKALGAAPASVAGMVMGRSLLSAAVASILSWPFGWWIANSWLSGYAYRTGLGPVVLPVATLIVLAFVALAVLLNTVRAAAIRPGSALRSA